MVSVAAALLPIIVLYFMFPASTQALVPMITLRKGAVAEVLFSELCPITMFLLPDRFSRKALLPITIYSSPVVSL